MMSINSVSEVNGDLSCSCGAKSSPQDRARFLKRHPELCNKRKAAGVHTNIANPNAAKQRENPDLYRLTQIETTGRGLTDWEKNFIGDMRGKLNHGFALTDNQKQTIEQIYVERTPN